MANMMQAMQPHFPVWSQIRAGWKSIVEQGITALAKGLASSPEATEQAINQDGSPVFDEMRQPVMQPPDAGAECEKIESSNANAVVLRMVFWIRFVTIVPQSLSA